MIVIIFAILLSLEVAYFATQNVSVVSLRFGPYVLTGVPVYVALLCALLLGLIIAWIFHLIPSFSSHVALHGKERELKEADREIAQLTKTIHQLELDNARLRVKAGEEESADDKSL